MKFLKRIVLVAHNKERVIKESILLAIVPWITKQYRIHLDVYLKNFVTEWAVIFYFTDAIELNGHFNRDINNRRFVVYQKTGGKVDVKQIKRKCSYKDLPCAYQEADWIWRCQGAFIQGCTSAQPGSVRNFWIEVENN